MIRRFLARRRLARLRAREAAASRAYWEARHQHGASFDLHRAWVRAKAELAAAEARA